MMIGSLNYSIINSKQTNKQNLPNLATNCTTILSPAIAQRASKALSSYKTSQLSLDYKNQFQLFTTK